MDPFLSLVQEHAGTANLSVPRYTKPDSATTNSIIVISICIVVYLTLVRATRWRRYNAIHIEYGLKWMNGRGTITPEEAQKIAHISTMYDMPLLMNYAVAFALFKTYGIPSISKLLVATKELNSQESVSRRYIDTGILIATWFGCPISGFFDPSMIPSENGSRKSAEDPRAMVALARVNWLHSKYNISNDDFLYTLCLFALEPATWANRYGWRSLAPLERHAFYVLWVEIGKRMGIQDIPGTLDDMILWSKTYERKYMVPAATNQSLAKYTVDELLAVVPKAFGLRSLGERIVICLMDDIVREAMMYPKQPWLLRATLRTTLSMVAFVQGYLLPPRMSPKFAVDISPLNSNTHKGESLRPRLHPVTTSVRPWYRPEPAGVFSYYQEKLLVKLGWFSEMPGPHLKSQGYRLEELVCPHLPCLTEQLTINENLKGPAKFENAGHEEIMRNAAELLGCPVVGPWSLEGREKAD